MTALTQLRAIVPALGLLLAAACTSQPAAAEPNFDRCLITNMAAVQMLDESITASEDRLPLITMTLDAYHALQLSLAADRETIANLLTLREDMLRDDALDDSEQAARNSTLMRSYANGADAAIAEARASGIFADTLAAEATSCAKSLTQ